MAPYTSHHLRPSSPSFPRFSSLPTELRLKIWAYCLPDSRIVDIVAIIASEESHREYGIRPTSPPPDSPGTSFQAQLFPALASPEVQYTTVTSYFQSLHVAPEPFLSLSHVNVEARDFVRKRFSFRSISNAADGGRGREIQIPDAAYMETRSMGVMRSELNEFEVRYILKSSAASGPNILFNPKTDVFFLANPRGIERTSHLSTLFRWLNPDVLSLIEYLAMPYVSWRKDPLTSWEQAKRLPNLKCLWVCFVGEEETTPKEEGWLSAVNTLTEDSYFAQAKRQVLTEVRLTEMEIRFENETFKMPTIEVLRDRKALRAALDGIESRDSKVNESHEGSAH